MITPEDRSAILAAVGTFRMGAPILTDDVRVACAVDGHSIRHIPGPHLAKIIQERCDPAEGPYGRKDFHSWKRRW